MRPFTPTLGARDTGKNARNFIKDNTEILRDIVKPLLIWIIGFALLDTIITIIYFSESDSGFGLFGILSGYLFTCIAISWHRVVIHGPDNFKPMTPLKPKKHELAFLGMGLALGLMGFILGATGGATFFVHPVLGGIGIFAGILLAAYLGYKFSFYFPAKAVDSSITLGQSFKMTQGYFWKMMAAYLFTTWRLLLLMVAYFLIASLIIGLVITSVEGSPSEALITNILAFFVAIPILTYFYPIMYGLIVTVLSNYYQHAVQNKGIPQSGNN